MTQRDLNTINSIVCERFPIGIKNNLMEEIEINAICTDLIIKSWWASWLPFGWMHSLAASYYAKKARRIFNSRSTSIQL